MSEPGQVNQEDNKKAEWESQKERMRQVIPHVSLAQVTDFQNTFPRHVRRDGGVLRRIFVPKGGQNVPIEDVELIRGANSAMNLAKGISESFGITQSELVDHKEVFCVTGERDGNFVVHGYGPHSVSDAVSNRGTTGSSFTLVFDTQEARDRCLEDRPISTIKYVLARTMNEVDENFERPQVTSQGRDTFPLVFASSASEAVGIGSVIRNIGKVAEPHNPWEKEQNERERQRKQEMETSVMTSLPSKRKRFSGISKLFPRK